MATRTDLQVIETPEAVDLSVLADEIRSTSSQAISSARTAVEHARRCGELLIEAKVAVPHGLWLAWLGEHTELSPQTAQRWMRLAKAEPEQIEGGIARSLGAISKPKRPECVTAECVTGDASPAELGEEGTATDAELAPLEGLFGLILGVGQRIEMDLGESSDLLGRAPSDRRRKWEEQAQRAERALALLLAELRKS